MSARGKVVVLSGAGGTLGPAIAARFASEGVGGLVIGDIDGSMLDTLASSLDCPAAACLTDVSDEESVQSLVRAAVERFGRLDVLINNAGVLSPNARIHNIAAKDWDRAFSVNVMGVVNGIKAAYPVMKAQGGGSIINTASVAGLTAWTHSAPYGASKAAIIHLTKMAAVEYAKERIRVNCVCPGVFPSAMHTGLGDAVMAGLAARHPLGLGTPADLTGAYLYLASDDSRWTTGSALVVDGGYAAP